MFLTVALTRLRGRTVAIDFDGVIHSYTSGWTGHVPTDLPTPGAVTAVRELLDAGVEVVVYTTRAETPEGAAATVAWLQEHGFPPLPVTAGKPKAVAYIDDRAVPFRGRWEEAIINAAVLTSSPQRPRCRACGGTGRAGGDRYAPPPEDPDLQACTACGGYGTSGE